MLLEVILVTVQRGVKNVLLPRIKAQKVKVVVSRAVEVEIRQQDRKQQQQRIKEDNIASSITVSICEDKL